jgi:hypothetical protein
LSGRPAEQLLADLQAIDAPAIGLHPTAWARGFLGTDDEPRFGGGVLGSAKPVAVPAMRELVRRGIIVLPLLLKHLDDPEPTKLTVRPFAGAILFCTEYAARNPDPANPLPKGLDGAIEPPLSADPYTVKVGDVCFVLIGQICIQSDLAVRYQPTGCLVINSPVVKPALAAAVRRDWSTLTAEEHRLLLYSAAKAGDAGAITRLRLYYPRTAKALAKRSKPARTK